MNIITGRYKGRVLHSIDSLGTRPTLARVKESTFDMIDEKIPGAVVLDLFAGSGALGIECLSRGAKKVFFVDNNPQAKQVILKNLIRVVEPYDIDIFDFKVALMTFKKQNLKFDLVFLDPPYNSDYGEIALDLMAELKLLNKGATIIYEEDCKKNLQKDREEYIIKKCKTYGLASVTLLEYVGE